jgi:cytochrome c oxidase subunit 3
MSTHNHPYHLVDQSPWPLTGAIGAIILTTGIVKWFHTFSNDLLFLRVTVILLTIYQWWRDVTREGTYQGLHTYPVVIGLRWGIILFIASEVLFFFSFFWAYFHRSLSPTIELGSIWPPKGILPFDPISIPILNTSILLASGVTVTWAHHRLIEGNHSQGVQALFFTVLLGFYFTLLQAYEYIEAPFTIADSVYGSTFFVATGFHGIHVIIGTLFLSVCLIRHYLKHFSSGHHFGFEAAAWYWHFVDVVWLFLYISIYWWGRYLLSILVYLTSNQKDRLESK